jgi:hypothetical protein
MSTLYTDAIQPNLESRVAIPGHIIQVVQGSYSTDTTVTSASDVTTGLTASITPTSTSSQILVMVDSPFRINGQGGVGCYLRTRVYRDGSPSSNYRFYYGYDNGDNWYDAGNVAITYIDSPSTTSSVSYELYALIEASSFSRSVRFQNNDDESTITLMEIAQ